ncbi:hypothetical protein pb186bvf_000031 [Paramecium bursaria]
MNLIPQLRGPLRTTTPDQKASLRCRKQFDRSIKEPIKQPVHSLLYISPCNIIERAKSKKHFSPSPIKEQTHRLRQNPLFETTLDCNLVPKQLSTQSTQSTRRLKTEGFDETNDFQQRFQAKQKENIPTYTQNTSIIQSAKSRIISDSGSNISLPSSRQNYFNKYR